MRNELRRSKRGRSADRARWEGNVGVFADGGQDDRRQEQAHTEKKMNVYEVLSIICVTVTVAFWTMHAVALRWRIRFYRKESSRFPQPWRWSDGNLDSETRCI